MLTLRRAFLGEEDGSPVPFWLTGGGRAQPHSPFSSCQSLRQREPQGPLQGAVSGHAKGWPSEKLVRVNVQRQVPS